MLSGSSSDSYRVSAAPPDESLQAITAIDLGINKEFVFNFNHILLNNIQKDGEEEL